jgi:hypothetical protein
VGSSRVEPGSGSSQQRRSSRQRRSARADITDVDEDELQTVLQYCQLPRQSVTRAMLQSLSTSAELLYFHLRDAPPPEPATPPSSSPVTAQRPVASASAATSTPSQPAASYEPALAMSLPSMRAQPAVVSLNPAPPATARTLAMPPHHVSWSMGGDEGAEDQPGGGDEHAPPVQFSPTSKLQTLLQRQGVPAGLVGLDALQMARNEVGTSSFEQWWSARSSHIRSVSTAVYYEGLVLSLLLDYANDPEVWTQLAARRWCSLNVVANGGLQWSQARGLLPLASVGSMPTSCVYELQKYARSQQELYASSTRPASNARGKGAGKGAGGKAREEKGKGGGSTAPSSEEGAEATAGGSRGSKQRRNSASGAGAPSATGAGRG